MKRTRKTARVGLATALLVMTFGVAMTATNVCSAEPRRLDRRRASHGESAEAA